VDNIQFKQMLRMASDNHSIFIPSLFQITEQLLSVTDGQVQHQLELDIVHKIEGQPIGKDKVQHLIQNVLFGIWQGHPRTLKIIR
jgi:hypothetical protein